MLDKKIRIFSVFIFFGIAALFFPATAFSNAVANAQQEVYSLDYQEEEARYGYYNDDNEESYYSYEDSKKKDPIVLIKKKLFVCENARNPEDGSFQCNSSTPFGDFFPAGPDSGQYIPCTADLCPGIDESEFAVQIFKDVATVRDLTPEGTKVNLDKFHYSVAESAINRNIDFDSESTDPFVNNSCFPVGFTHTLEYLKVTNNPAVEYFICVNYVGDCDGTIYPGEVKTCTVENYIYSGIIVSAPTTNAIDDTTTGTTTPNTITQSSNTEGEIPNTALSVPLDSIS